MDARAAGRLRLFAAALLFSTGGAAIKACSFGGLQVAALRSLVAAVALLLLLPEARRWPTRAQALVAVAYAGTLILYVVANKLTTASNAIFLQSTAPLYLLVISPLWLGEALRRRDLLFMVALAVGLALFFVEPEAASGTATNPALGNTLAALCAIAWAFTVAGLRWLARTEDPATRAGAAVGAAVHGNVLVFVLCIPFALPLTDAGATDWLWIAYLGCFQIGLAYLFMTRGVRSVPALEASLLLLVEPVLNTVWAWWVHDEIPGPWARAGALVILLATLAHAFLTERQGPGVRAPIETKDPPEDPPCAPLPSS
ncbi:MAG: DMT family transporter [Planctomycetota bacterium]|nr:DMT family transporter [Planctomycetota bacterium]